LFKKVWIQGARSPEEGGVLKYVETTRGEGNAEDGPFSTTRRKKEGLMEGLLNQYLDQIKIGGKQVYKNLALFPLLSAQADSLDYLTLDEALKDGLVEVTEVSEGGHVPDLKVVNNSPRMILILDGEELVGAKQNRIVNTTILVAAYSTLDILVSGVCLPVAKVAEAEDPRRSRVKPYKHTASPGQRRRFGLPGFPEG
jgi:hypothetical protein